MKCKQYYGQTINKTSLWDKWVLNSMLKNHTKKCTHKILYSIEVGPLNNRFTYKSVLEISKDTVSRSW